VSPNLFQGHKAGSWVVTTLPSHRKATVFTNAASPSQQPFTTTPPAKTSKAQTSNLVTYIFFRFNKDLYFIFENLVPKKGDPEG